MIVLASQSASRKAMLDAAGIAFLSAPVPVDERAIESSMGNAEAADVALALAGAKAMAASPAHPGMLVLGSDSLVSAGGRRFDKPMSRDDAADHLRFFSGRTLHLHSAAALVRDGFLLWSGADCARLHVRQLSEQFIAEYLDHEWPAVGGCVGVFRIEARGPHLFEAIEGDQFTVLGMPLLKVLAALRAEGEILA